MMATMKNMFKRFIVIDGPDGSGKSTQLELTKKYLTKPCTSTTRSGFSTRDNMHSIAAQVREKGMLLAPKNMDVSKLNYAVLSFPDYKEMTGRLVQEMLNGAFGDDAKSLNPYFASSMYAIDRYQAMDRLYKHIKRVENRDPLIDRYEFCLSARYTISNIIHQGARIKNLDELNKYIEWLNDYEFNLLGLPKPTLQIYLDTPVEVSYEAIVERSKKTGQVIDINESKEYLTEVYNHIQFLKRFNILPSTVYIDTCNPDGSHRTIEDINDEILFYIDKVWWNCEHTVFY